MATDSSLSLQFEPTAWQKQFLLHILREKENHIDINNICTAYTVWGNVDVELLRSALRYVVGRHESLRTLVVQPHEGDTVLYRVLENVEPDITVVDGVHGDAERAAEKHAVSETKRLLAGFFWRSFGRDDLPVRACVIRLSSEKYSIGLATSHFTTDAQSHDIIWDEFSRSYQSDGACWRGAPPPVQYRKFVAARNEWEANWRHSKQASYWQSQLQHDYSRTYTYPDATAAGGCANVVFGSEVLQTLSVIASRAGVTGFVVILTLFIICLAKDSREGTVSFAILADERGKPEYRSVVGNFPMIRPFRVSVSGDPTFAELIARVGGAWFEMLLHPWMPGEVLHKFVSQNPPPALFDVVDYVKIGAKHGNNKKADDEVGATNLFGCRAERLTVEPPSAEYRRPNAFLFIEGEGSMLCRPLSADTVTLSRMTRLLQSMQALLPTVAKSDTAKLSELSGYAS